MDMPTTPESVPNPAPKERGCLFFIAVAAAALFAIALLSSALLAYGARHLLIAYTGTSGVTLPASPLPAAASEAAAERYKTFKENFEKSPNGASLVLSEDEINALLIKDPKSKEALTGKLHISLGKDTIKAQISFPLEKSGVPFTRGRYLNGEVALKASLENGVLIATIDSIVLNDKPFPEALMSELRSENVAKKIYERPKNAEALRKFESIRIKDGEISFKLRP